MSEHTAMNIVAGFAAARCTKAELERSGSLFHELTGQVASTIAQLHPKRLALEVLEVIDETPSTRTLRLVSPSGDQLPPFQAGQYINLFVEIDGVATARPYAISSPPGQRGYYDLTVKRASAGFVSHYLLDQVGVGQALVSSGPMGSFYHNPLYHGADLVFLAGGSGSAPARSMLLDMLERDLDQRFHLIYANSHIDDVIYAEELQALAERHPRFQLTQVISRPLPGYWGYSGRISHEMLAGLVGAVEGKMFYLCGPTAFNENCAALLQAMGVPARRIRIEANGPPKAPDQQPGWPAGVDLDAEVTVTVKGRGRFSTRVGEPLLNALERNGYGAENACRSGECSLCRIKLLSGRVFNPREAHLRQSDRDFGWIYACVAFPLGDIEVLL